MLIAMSARNPSCCGSTSLRLGMEVCRFRTVASLARIGYLVITILLP